MSITAPKPQRGFQFNHHSPGQWRKPQPAKPKEIPFPTTRRQQKQPRPLHTEENLSTILDLLSPFSKQCLVFPSCNPPSRGISRTAGMREPGETLPQSTAMFSVPCGAGCILHNGTKPLQGSSPSLRRTPIGCQLSLGIAGTQRQRRKGLVFGGGGTRGI